MYPYYSLNNDRFFSSRDVISETESDNQQRQIHQEAHRVFRSRRHISEDLENEHLEPRDLDNVREKNIHIRTASYTFIQHAAARVVSRDKIILLFHGCVSLLLS